MEEFSARLCAIIAELEQRTTELEFYVEELGSFKTALVQLIMQNPTLHFNDIATAFPFLKIQRTSVRGWIQRYKSGVPLKSYRSWRRRCSVYECSVPLLSNPQNQGSTVELQYGDDEDIFSDDEVARHDRASHE